MTSSNPAPTDDQLQDLINQLASITPGEADESTLASVLDSVAQFMNSYTPTDAQISSIMDTMSSDLGIDTSSVDASQRSIVEAMGEYIISQYLLLYMPELYTFGMIDDILLSHENADSYLGFLSWMFTIYSDDLGMDTYNRITTIIDARNDDVDDNQTQMTISDLATLWDYLVFSMVESSTTSSDTITFLTAAFLSYTRIWMNINYSDAMTTVFSYGDVLAWIQDETATLEENNDSIPSTVETDLGAIFETVDYEDGLSGLYFRYAVNEMLDYFADYISDDSLDSLRDSANTFLSGFASYSDVLPILNLSDLNVTTVSSTFGSLSFTFPVLNVENLQTLFTTIVTLPNYIGALGTSQELVLDEIITLFDSYTDTEVALSISEVYSLISSATTLISSLDSDLSLSFQDTALDIVDTAYLTDLETVLEEVVPFDEVDSWLSSFETTIDDLGLSYLDSFYAEHMISELLDLNNMPTEGVSGYNFLQIGVTILEYLHPLLETDDLESIAEELMLFFDDVLFPRVTLLSSLGDVVDDSDSDDTSGDSGDESGEDTTSDDGIGDDSGDTSEEDEDNTGAIVGGVIGGAVTLAGIGLGAYYGAQALAAEAGAALADAAVSALESAAQSVAESLEQAPADALGEIEPELDVDSWDEAPESDPESDTDIDTDTDTDTDGENSWNDVPSDSEISFSEIDSNLQGELSDLNSSVDSLSSEGFSSDSLAEGMTNVETASTNLSSTTESLQPLVDQLVDEVSSELVDGIKKLFGWS